MKVMLLAALAGFLIFVSPVFALDITVSVDKTKVLPGENFTISGKITYDNGTAGIFSYRAAAVAPGGKIVCDTKKTQTSADGSFTLVCNVPTKDQANALGIPSALTRSVIPLKAGVTVLDASKNETVKRHAKEILVVNPEKFKRQLEGIYSAIDNFAKTTNVISAECDKVVEKAQRFNVTNISNRCEIIKVNISRINADVASISAQAKQLVANISAASIEDFKDGLSIIRDDLKSLRTDIKDTREDVKSVRWENLKEVKAVAAKEVRDVKNATAQAIKSGVDEIKSEAREVKSKITEEQNKIKSLNERIKEVRSAKDAASATTVASSVKPVGSTSATNIKATTSVVTTPAVSRQ